MKEDLKKEFKKMKAITLIALIITIVVLIILVGVIISITLGNGGIINRAKTAKQEYANAQDCEQTQIAKTANEIDNITNTREMEKVDLLKNLLWTNPNPNSNFSAQTLDLDLSNYKFVLIITKASTTYEYLPRAINIVPVNLPSGTLGGETVFATGAGNYRSATATSTGLTISGTSGGSPEYAIPLYVYGIEQDLGIYNYVTNQ